MPIWGWILIGILIILIVYILLFRIIFKTGFFILKLFFKIIIIAGILFLIAVFIMWIVSLFGVDVPFDWLK
ncbi:MAG: hypothetical protein HPAVJP_2160 [Candidatus Hepatoplasma vulgare]|nr:MAG: hypothetical protein HPAVJP_2160 [Candidatus Hepatoplasma sp.]